MPRRSWGCAHYRSGVKPPRVVVAFLAGFRGSILAGHQPAIWSGIDIYQLALAMGRGNFLLGEEEVKNQ
jgi:hypothetical protein